jgi:hypothetical protein
MENHSVIGVIYPEAMLSDTKKTYMRVAARSSEKADKTHICLFPCPTNSSQRVSPLSPHNDEGDLTPKTTQGRRIAVELQKLYYAGHISGPDDPFAATIGMLIHETGGAVHIPKDEKPTGSPKLTREQLVCPPEGLTRKQLRKWYDDDLHNAING